MNSKLVFLSNFLENPKQVAAITPSSRHVIKNIINRIDFKKTKYILEFGPGIGNLTNALLLRLNPNARLICFEINSKLCNYVNNTLKDPRLIVINDKAENIDQYLEKLNIDKIDYALSALPFSLIKKEDKINIIKKTNDKLREGGKFIVYQQYSNKIKKYLGLYFKNISINYEIRNIPPTFIYTCEK